MDGLVTDKKAGRFISIKSHGKFEEKVAPGTEGSEHVEYEFVDRKTGQTVKGEKDVMRYPRIENLTVTNVEFEDGDYGKNILVTLSDGEDEIVWAQGVATPFGEDLMKKLPAVDFAEKISVQPYAFINEKNGKPVRGVNIYQKSDKVLSHFWDGEKAINGIPEVEQSAYETFTSEDWTVHFITVRKFLVAYIDEHVRPNFVGREEKEEVKGFEYPESDLKPEDIPFD